MCRAPAARVRVSLQDSQVKQKFLFACPIGTERTEWRIPGPNGCGQSSTPSCLVLIARDSAIAGRSHQVTFITDALRLRSCVLPTTNRTSEPLARHALGRLGK